MGTLLPLSVGLPLLVFCVFALGALAAAAPPTLRILARYPVPSAPSPATDVRWASDASVYLARDFDGVTEVALDGKLTPRSQVVPQRRAFHFRAFQHLAVSRDALVVASETENLAWRYLAPSADGMVRFDHFPNGSVADVDLWGDRLLLLGFPHRQAIKGHQEIAWIGSLKEHLNDLRPLLSDTSEDGTRMTFHDCLGPWVGAARFLTDGSFIVVPGSQPGAFLYSPGGVLRRTWDTDALGLTTAHDCAATDDERRHLDLSPEMRLAWINRHRVLDEILPLPEGPGLLVRSWEQGEARWQLKVLRAAGAVTYNVPLTSTRPWDRLRGDVGDGKIVLLLSAQVSYASGGWTSPGELIVAQLP